jgi:hypothetical protein
MATKKKGSSKSARSASARPQGSGKTLTKAEEGQQSVTLPKDGVAPLAPGSFLQTFFGRTSPDCAPGWNTLTLNGLPAGTRVITVWMTEWTIGNFSHAGGAWFTTASVQLYNGGRQCRVRYHSSWHTHLPAGYMVIYGPG